jgi:hypothetical protein
VKVELTTFSEDDVIEYFMPINRLHRALHFSCRTLQTPRSDESYIPCTLAYSKISTLILFDEQSKVNYQTHKNTI